MTKQANSQKPEIRLQCFHGNPAPQPVVEGWRRFILFPEEARANFWTILIPALVEPANPENRQRVESFCREHGLGEEDVVAALRSCDFLLRQASALDLDAAAFEQDLAALSEGDLDAAGIILSQFKAAKEGLRNQITLESLADHGKVLLGLDWRVDNVSASDRGTRLNATVVFLTLRYREGDRLERVTLQLTPEAIRELKLFADRFSG